MRHNLTSIDGSRAERVNAGPASWRVVKQLNQY